MSYFSLTILLLSMLSILSRTSTSYGANYLYHFCANTTIPKNSPYKSSLSSLFSSFSLYANHNVQFYSPSSSSLTSSLSSNAISKIQISLNISDPIYGLHICRSDVTAEVCRECVEEAAKDLANRCSRELVAVIWYDECMIRYSNVSFFSTVAIWPRVALLNTQNTTKQEQFNRLVNTTMTDLASRASNVTAGANKFGVNQVNISEFQTLYSLVQCTPDLSNTDCNSCLQAAINRLPICCNGKQGARVLSPSCHVRYELYAFYTGPVPTPELPPLPPSAGSTNLGTLENERNTARIAMIIAFPTVVAMILVISICIFLRARKPMDTCETVDEITSVESLQFEFSTIRAATDNFSDANKLGKGGFGVVYRGTLPEGQEIAVKRLSRNSGQGDQEFQNEVLLVAKLQHRNLVKLLGFCLEGNERLLIYEFVPNTSLDHYIFDSMKRANLNWERRYKIIGGVARGLLYLHEDSRLRIIHRDLKAANILLDSEMNPKISDFGMARMFVLDQSEGTTNRIVGTHGYMAPEYAMFGQFSVKSDIFSFGVLILEIVSGQKITRFRDEENIVYLLTYAWENWREGTTSNLIDPTLRSGPIAEMMRCIHIGLLCVQQNVTDRPNMTSVLLMLNSNSVALPAPTQPASFLQSNLPSAESLQEGINSNVTKYEVSITELCPR